MRRTITLTTVLGVVSLSPAFADTPNSGRFYAGVGVGYSSVDGTARTDASFPADLAGSIDSVAINGLPFDDDDVAWSAFIGYAATPYVGVEAGYWDHGTYDRPDRFVGLISYSLDIQEWYFGSTFQYPLPFWNRLALTGSVGVSRAQFDVEGSAQVLVLPPGPPFFPPTPRPPTTRTLPFATPDDETGGYWRAGVNVRITDSIGAGLNYGRRYLDVLQLETAALSVSYTF